MAVVLITHDLGIVRHFASRVAVMRRGEVVETGTSTDVFERPGRTIPECCWLPSRAVTRRPPATTLRSFSKARTSRSTLPSAAACSAGRTRPSRRRRRQHPAEEGQTIGIVGKSGSGKSTLGRALLRLMPSSGRYHFGATNISDFGRAAMRPLRRELQLVFQDPYGSLSPRLTVGEIVTEGLCP